jgi:hypothetical protein
LSDAEVDGLLGTCPPLRALALGQLMGFHVWSLRGHQGRKGKPAGRADLAMAAYLPYCNWFVTNDFGQQQALSEVAVATNLECQVVSLDEFEAAVAAGS